MHRIDPVFVEPRAIAREWGRADLGEWWGLVGKTDGAIGEVWVSHGAGISINPAVEDLTAVDSAAALGSLQRPPPPARLVFPGRRVRLASTCPMSFWIVLEPGQTGIGPVRYQGERIFARDGACLELAPASIALELSASVLPPTTSRDVSPLTWARAAPPRARVILQRDKALSVEMWTLPARSRLTPNGRCCHLVIAVSSGAIIDDRPLRPGDAVMVPASGRAFDIVTNRPDARVIVAYPDFTMTNIWRRTAGTGASEEDLGHLSVDP